MIRVLCVPRLSLRWLPSRSIEASMTCHVIYLYWQTRKLTNSNPGVDRIGAQCILSNIYQDKEKKEKDKVLSWLSWEISWVGERVDMVCCCSFFCWVTRFCLLICNALQGSLPWKKRKKVCQTWRGPKKGLSLLHQYTPCQIALRFMKSYISTPECAFYFSLLLSLDIYPSPEMLYMCVYIEPKWWISSCASCHVGDMPSDMALAPFFFPIFPPLDFFRLTRKAKKEEEKLLNMYTAYCIYTYRYLSIQ